MQTSKYEIGANLQGLEFRRQANEILAALASSNAGNLEPASAQAGTVWLDTSNNKKHLLKIRNKANSAWGILFSIDAQSGVVDTIDAYTKVESDSKFALKTDFEASKQDNGYTKLPNGLIIQWGVDTQVPQGDNTKMTFFPIVFPTACIALTLAHYGAGKEVSAMSYGTPSRTGAIFRHSWPHTPTAVAYIAIGY